MADKWNTTSRKTEWLFVLIEPWIVEQSKYLHCISHNVYIVILLQTHTPRATRKSIVASFSNEIPVVSLVALTTLH